MSRIDASNMTCRECGAAATTVVSDLDEIESSNQSRNWKVRDRVALCDTDDRPANLYMLDGTIRSSFPVLAQ